MFFFSFILISVLPPWSRYLCELTRPLKGICSRGTLYYYSIYITSTYVPQILRF